MVDVAPHPLLRVHLLSCALPAALADLATPATVDDAREGVAPAGFIPPEDTVRTAVRDLLRHGGYKPTGRGKPSCEYLARAVGAGSLGAINLLVDVTNAASLHAGVPISVVDLDSVRGGLRIDIAPGGSSYPFNASGQEIDVGGLLCLHDTIGPCANAVKDAQRTKTSATTRRALIVVWGVLDHEARSVTAIAWMTEALDAAGVRVMSMTPPPAGSSVA